MSSFEDHFSELAQEYAQFRPQYPRDLFVYLASLPAERQLAWDCGTGNGQAAQELVQHFSHVVATDASAEQIAQAGAHSRIEYRVERAENVKLGRHSVDLVSAAQAVHWFELGPFYKAVRRAAKPQGIIAIWMYHLPVIDRAIDQVLDDYLANVLAGYWPERIHFLADRYQTLPFPFKEIETPEFEMNADWDLAQLAGFLHSWSATQRYQKARGQHPAAFIWQRLLAAWGNPQERRRIRWPLHMRVGRIR